ncbi:MAG TPA: DUF4230 domain-containing protein [Anaerolineales bacterium]|nr:DUF4230 domain-containing protein [Anaerolineales bacterium]
MDNSRGWALVIGILAILAFGMFMIVSTIRALGEQALAPVQRFEDVGDTIGTQVADVLNPTATVLPDPVAIVHDVRTLARFETVQYSIERVITAESGQNIFSGLFGDRLLFVAHGIVIAGVDMQKLQPEDLRLENGVLYVRLPPPEIFIATLDNEKSYVYDRDTGLLSKGNVDLETEARRVAEESIAEAALEDGILETARRNAELFFSLLFRDLGYPAVIFEPVE